MAAVAVRVNRSTSTDGLTLSDHSEPSVSHADVVSSTAAHYNLPSSKPVCTVTVVRIPDDRLLRILPNVVVFSV